MKKDRLYIAIAVIMLLMLPIRTTLNDGGTVVYNSLTYKFIAWNEKNDLYQSGYKEGYSSYLFPNNFKSVQYYSDLDNEYQKKRYSIFKIEDESTDCDGIEEEIYRDYKYKYIIDCQKGTHLIVTYKTDDKENVIDALSERHISIADLDEYGISYRKISIDGTMPSDLNDTEDVTLPEGSENHTPDDAPEEEPTIPITETE